MEALSEVLREVKLNGAAFLDAEFREPWCVVARGRLARMLMPEATHFIHYHYVAEGPCLTRTEDGRAEAALSAGDVVVFPYGDSHVVGTDLQLAPRSIADIIRPPGRSEVARVRYGGDGAKTRLICGFLACDPQLCSPILSALPPVFNVNMRASPSGDWLERSLRHSLAEVASPRAGADVILARLSEVLFVEALRCYVESLPSEQRGWLAGLRDPYVGKGLKLLHADSARAWTVDGLAREVGCSRSILADRFTHYVGQPPIQYLTKWRLTLAASQLRSKGLTLARVAERFGYESEAAFNRAFKREFGMPPAQWRRHQRGPAPGLNRSMTARRELQESARKEPSARAAD
jgi:AraC family transcriptional regulator, alkane utilization regulator